MLCVYIFYIYVPIYELKSRDVHSYTSSGAMRNIYIYSQWNYESEILEGLVTIHNYIGCRVAGEFMFVSCLLCPLVKFPCLPLLLPIHPSILCILVGRWNNPRTRWEGM